MVQDYQISPDDGNAIMLYGKGKKEDKVADALKKEGFKVIDYGLVDKNPAKRHVTTKMAAKNDFYVCVSASSVAKVCAVVDS